MMEQMGLLLLGGTLVTSSAAELNKLDGYNRSAIDFTKDSDYTGNSFRA